MLERGSIAPRERNTSTAQKRAQQRLSSRVATAAAVKRYARLRASRLRQQQQQQHRAVRSSRCRRCRIKGCCCLAKRAANCAFRRSCLYIALGGLIGRCSSRDWTFQEMSCAFVLLWLSRLQFCWVGRIVRIYHEWSTFVWMKLV